MQLDLEIPDRLVRKIRALNILEGDRDPDQVEALLVSSLEDTVERRIRGHLGESPSPEEFVPPRNIARYNREESDRFSKHAARSQEKMRRDVAAFKQMSTDESGMSDGLGDFEEDMPEDESDEEAFVPKTGGVSDKDIDDDMTVDDPEHEAKAEAAAYPGDISPEQILSNVVGIPLPPPEDVEVDPRIARKKRNVKLKGKVTDATDSNLHDLL